MKLKKKHPSQEGARGSKQKVSPKKPLVKTKKVTRGGKTIRVPYKRPLLATGKGSGAPKGNKNALKTGEYEQILIENLPDEERELFGLVKTDNLHLLETEIRLMTVREKRILDRIEKAKEKAFHLVETNTSEGIKEDKITDKSDEKRVSNGTIILDLEEALTRVQREKGRLIEIKQKVEMDQPPESSNEGFLKYVQALGLAVNMKDLWKDGPAEDYEGEEDEEVPEDED